MPRQANNARFVPSATLRVVLLLTCFLSFAIAEMHAVTRTVTSSANSGANTLRNLIGASSDGDVIEFDASISTITLTSQIEITTTLTITGPAADELTISGGSSSRIFLVNGSGKTVSISGIKFLDGRSQTAPIVNFIVGGGAISHSQGILNIDECEFEGNVTDDGNGTTSFGYGGAIVSHDELNVTNSLFYDNSVSGSNAYGGGAVYCQDNGADHDVTFNNCTFYSNAVTAGNAAADGGGLYVAEEDPGGGTSAPLAEITNCTFYDNRSSSEGEQLHITTNGGDVGLVLRNNIFDNSVNTAIQSVTCDCSGGLAFTTNGGNIYWDTPDTEITTGGTRDQANQGVDGAGLSGTLALNGGPTRTIDISTDASLADDNGVSGGPTLTRDQRDFARAGNPDSGAFEFEGLFTFRTLDPADNSTSNSVTTNLVMTFRHNITIGSGNILIKRTTNASTVETIAANGAAVTGGGTKTITINPTLALPGSTGVYVEVPQSAFIAPDGDSELQAISGNATWNFETGPSPNSAPSISTTNTAAVMLEDSNGSLYVSIVDAESSTINLVLTAASDDISIVPTSNITQIGLTRATTCFRVTTANANQSGSVGITLTVTDEGGLSASTTFSLTITAVNDVPTFTTGANVAVLEDSGAFAAAFATGIDDGDAEATQALTFHLINNNTALFSSQPTITAAGKLNFTPAADAAGLAVVTVSLSDDGGTANGGVNTTATQTFNIAVNSVNDAPTFSTGATVTVNEDSGAFSGGFATGIDDGDAEAVQVLTFNVANNDNALFTVQPSIAANGVLSFTPATNANGVATVTVSLSDDGGTANGGVATSATQNFEIVVNAVNDIPVFSTGGNVVTLEDSGAFVAGGVATSIDDGDPDEIQDLTFHLINNNTALFSSQPTLSAGGVLNFTLAADAAGLAVVTVSLSDDGGTANGGVNTTATQTFNITVTGINDPPTFSTGANVAVNEDSGAFAAGFATGIDDGDAEFVQNVTFTVTNGNAALFSVQPAIAANGDLSFTPAANANGVATVDVSLSDDGGVANGGNPTSATQSFSITVNAVNDIPSFSTGANVTVNEDSGAFSAAFATGIDDGDPEANQTLTFNVTNSNSLLFSVQPAIAANGDLSFTPAANTNGTVEVSVTLSDNGGTANGGVNTTATQTFNITINSVNDAPTFSTGATVTVNEDSGAFSGGFATGIDDGDAEAVQTLTFNVSNNDNALFTVQPSIAANGDLSFTPATNANGVATVTVSLSDDGGTANGGVATSATQNFDIVVNSVNDIPVFSTGGNVITLEDSGAFTAGGVATGIGDGDPDVVQTLTFHLINDNTALFSSQPTLSVGGKLDFTLAANAAGEAVVSVTLSDDGGTANGGVNTTATQTFNITVTGINDAPTFSTGATVTVNEDSGAFSAGFATGIDDGDAEVVQNLTFSVTNGNTALFSVQPTIAANGDLSFTPAANANGVASVDVSLSDDGGTANGGVPTSATQTFEIVVNAVNDIPSFSTGANVAVDEDSGAFSAAFATGIDDGDAETSQTLTFHVTNSNLALFTVQPAIAANGDLSFTPATNANGTAQLSVSLSDDGGTANGGVNTTATQIFSITVNAINDVPVFTTGANVVVNEDSGAFSAAFATGIDDGDPEAAQTLVFNVTNGNAGLFSVQPAIAANGDLSFTPAANANGVATVDVALSDDGGTANGGVSTSATQSFLITVNSVNDAPVFATGANVVVLEDSGLFSGAFATGIDDGDADAVQVLTFNVTHANAALFSSQPTISASGVLNFTPAADAAGSVSVSVSLSDDGGTANGGVATSATQNFNITLTPVNDAPAFSTGATVNVFEDSGLFSGAFATGIDDGDAETSQTLTFNVTNSNVILFSSQPTLSSVGTLHFTPAVNATGSALVSVFLMDDGGTANGGQNTSATQQFTIIVNAVNDPPQIATTNTSASTLEDQPITLSVSLSDPDTALNVITLTATSANTAILPNANITQLGTNAAITSFIVTSANNSNGTVLITFTADDGLSSSSTTITLNITPVNDIPSFATGANVTVLEDSGAFATGFATGVSDGDPETTQTLTFHVTNSNAALFTTQPSINSSGGLSFTPATNANGSALVTVSLSDDGGTANGGVNTTATQTFSITVTPVNDVPSFATLANVVVNEDTGLTTTLNVVSINDGDPEVAQSLTFNVTHGNAALFSSQPTISSTGVLTFTPASNANGVAILDLSLSDDGGEANGGVPTTATQSFTITVNAVNDIPSFTTGANVSVNEDSGAFSAAFATGIDDGDPETSQTLSFNVTTSNMALFSVQPAIAGNGNLSFTPAANTNGNASVFVTLSDDGGTANGGVNTTASQMFTISVLSVNDAPSFSTGAAVTVLEDSGLYDAAFATAISDGDPETSQTLSFVVTSANLAVFSSQPSISSTGNLSFIGETNANGSVQVQVSLKDDGGTANGGDDSSTTQTFSINITAVNDVPVFSTGANLVVDAGSSSATVFATGISDGDPETTQTLTFHTTVSNVSLFTSLPTVSVSSGKLNFAVTSNTSARVYVSLSLSDDGGTANGGVNTTATQEFYIDINNFNQPPVFSTGAKVTVAEDSGQYTAAFATGIDDGDVTTTQSLTFHVVATNSSLFSSQPTISTTGVLNFVTATDATGTTAVLVSLSDDGPSTGGNVNTSATQTFLICLTPVNDAPSIATIADLSVQESGSTSLTFSINDIDTPIGDLQVSASSSNMSIITNGGLTFSATAATMTLTLRPNCGATGPVDITVTVLDLDGPLSSSASFELLITPAPAFAITGAADPCPRSAEDYSIPVFAGATYTWEVVNGILVAGQGTTQATINWESGTTGTVQASIITPAGCTFASALVITSSTIAANPDFAATGTGASVTFNVLTNDQGTSLELVAASMPANGTLTTSASGQVTYTPDPGFEGFDSFNYTITDVNGCIETGASVQVVISNQVDRVNLHYVEHERDRVGGVRGLRGARFTDVSPDDKHVYVAGQLDNSIAWFEVNSADGSLTYGNRARHNSNGVKSMRNPTAVVISPDGKHAYVAAYGSGAVVVFKRNALTGVLTFLERKINGKVDAGKTIAGISRPLELAISGDGKTIYVSGYADHSLAVFRRDVNSGLLQFIERHKDGQSGVDGLRYPVGLTVSADGKTVYVASTGDNAISVFERDVTTGKLSYIERMKDGNAGVDGLADVTDVCVSPDGANVYGAGFGDEAVAIFDRASDGSLSFVNKIVGGLLDGVHGISCAPNGTHVYTAASIDDGVAILERDPANGELTYLEALRNNVDGVSGLNGAKNLVISSDGRYIWTASYDHRAVAVLYRNRQPKAKEDVVQVVENTSLAISVLTNDVEKDAGETLTIDSKTNGLLGSVSITGGGTTLTFGAGIVTGPDSFTYTIGDGKGGSSTATVSVVVNAAKKGFNGNTSARGELIEVKPNPVCAMANIDLYDVADSHLEVFVLDMQGRRVAELFNQSNSSETLRLIWNSRNDLLPAGNYLLVVERRIETGALERRQTRLQIVR